MVTAAVRRHVAALRQPASAARVARALWAAWAIIVWNVIFDHVIVVAGRKYIAAANRAAFAPVLPRQYENMDAWMRPAVEHGFWIASASGALIAVVGVLLVRAASAPTPSR